VRSRASVWGERLSEGEYLSHGTYEAKLTEMVQRCWEIRSTYMDETHLAAYRNKIYATYMFLPPSTRLKAVAVKDLLIKAVGFTAEARRAMNPLQRNRILLKKKYENADLAMQKLVDVMDKDKLLLLKDQGTRWQIGMDRSSYNPELNKVEPVKYEAEEDIDLDRGVKSPDGKSD
jgi:hypothetical protein